MQPEITLQVGSQLILTIEAMGNPLPFLQWYHNGQLLDSIPGHGITQTGPELTKPEALLEGPVPMTGRIVINELSTTDSGEYRCVAENVAGQAETFLTLNVIPPTSKKNELNP